MRNTLLAMALILITTTAYAQTWTEDGDAPDLLPGQTTVGDGAITTISGTLTAGTDVDLYAIMIDDPASFSAQTCGLTSIDSALYLFDESGNGVAMSEDGCGTQSSITNLFVTTAGLYYVAMTGYDYDPQNASALEIWNDSPWDTERAPDGPGAPGPLAGWGGSSGASGAYSIALTGASFAEYGPPPATGACCFLDGSCQVVTESACLGIGGTYHGDDTTCDPNPCPQPVTGACCFYTNGCLRVTEQFCLDNGGEYLGDDTVCWPNPCTEGGDPPSGGWEDNFDSYANGTFMYNVGGWTGWDDNAAAAGTISDVQAHSAPHSMAVNDTADAIHPVTNFEGGKWIITAWQYLPSDLSGMSYFVVNSYYEHGGPYYWTVEMHFDPTTDMVTDALRDPDGLNGVPIVYDQWVEIRIETDLTGGLGTIAQYYNDTLVMSGDWITGSIGQLAIGNIDLYAPHSTVIYYDDISIVPDDGGTTPQAPTRPLFAGVLYGDLNTRSTDLTGMPDVTWNNGFIFGVDGAAGLPDGSLYLTTGSFTTDLYLAPVEGPAFLISRLANATQGLAYGQGRLFGFCNYGSPMGIYEINPDTGDMVLVTATGSRRFFGLDYNPADGLLYGYDEYGSPSGLCSINIETGEIIRVAGSFPASNTAGRGLACGDNKAYVIPVYGADSPMYYYDLSQGPDGEWTPLTHPYPESNSTSGAAWTHPLAGDVDLDGDVDIADLAQLLANYGTTDSTWIYGDLDLDGDVDIADLATLLAVYGWGR